ncbi:MAG TPA: hypothetical protein VKF37_07385, partial [Chloroflexota bacterium]|nr:hypothetical protein [Chloroflexota bacterium]
FIDGLMRAVAVPGDRLVAIVAENAKANRIALNAQPPVQTRAMVTFLQPVPRDMVYGQKLSGALAAARTRGIAAAVMHECRHAVSLLAYLLCQVLLLGIGPHIAGREDGLAQLARVLKAAVAERCAAMEVIGGQG